MRRIPRIVPSKKSPDEILEQIKEIKDSQLMEMISDDRADEYHDWMNIGYALFSIGAGCEEGSEECLNLWIDFSKKSTKFDEGICEDKWQKMEPKERGFTIATLYYFAKEDSPERYKEWLKMRFKVILDDSLKTPKPNEYEIAQVIFKKYEGIFKCVNARKNEWYEFKNGKWQKLDFATSLLSIMRKDIAQLYIEHQIYLQNEAKKYIDKEEKKYTDGDDNSETSSQSDSDEEEGTPKTNKKKKKEKEYKK